MFLREWGRPAQKARLTVIESPNRAQVPLVPVNFACTFCIGAAHSGAFSSAQTSAGRASSNRAAVRMASSCEGRGCCGCACCTELPRALTGEMSGDTPTETSINPLGAAHDLRVLRRLSAVAGVRPGTRGPDHQLLAL